MGYVLDRPKRLSRKQVSKLRKSLKRNGESDIKSGTCRFVSKGVEICRDSKGYEIAQIRMTSKAAMRAARYR